MNLSITLIFLVIGALFWVIKTVAAVQARKAASEEYHGADSDIDWDKEVAEFYGHEQEPEFEEDAGFTRSKPSVPVVPPRPAPVQASAARPAPAERPQPRRAAPPAIKPRAAENPRGHYALWLKNNTRNAVLTQEVLGPPKSLQ
jgi:hypothetical protein